MIAHLDEVAELVRSRSDLDVRFSEDIQADVGTRTLDAESGILLPGLSVNPLTPEDWWSRPTVEWVARQLCQYAHLLDQEPRRKAWLIVGRVVGRGPDREPLLADIDVVDQIADDVLREAETMYGVRFNRS